MLLKAALSYLKDGLSIIPLRPRGKEPLISWTEFQSRFASESEVRGWLARWPTLNIGCVTGSVSGICVIDLDGPEGLQSASTLKLTSPIVSISGKGKHLWFKHPNVNVQNAVREFPGTDIRGDGGYVVVGPSVHENGQRYRWVTKFNRSILPEFPLHLLSQKAVATADVTSRKPPLDVKSLLEGMTNGNIDNSLFLVCSKLRGDNWSADDARLLLSPHALKAGATPGHLEDKIANVWTRYEPRPAASSEASGRPRVYGNAERSSLTIHSPSNNDSWEQYSKRSLDMGPDNKQLLSGYTKLDQMLEGGLKSSRLFTVAARTGTGKTNWLLGCAKSLCEQGLSVMLFSTEMAYTDVWDRYINLCAGTEQFRTHRFHVCDSFAPNLANVEKALNEIRPDVFMFDHINHVSEEQKELASFMQGLNFLRRKFDCAGIVAAQLNRSADWIDIKTGERVTPRASMIKGSGTIEQASSRVLLLSETRVGPEGSEIVGNLDKNDRGPKGLLHFGLKLNPYRIVEL